jgi:subtilisin-like proprotein convertase family protein
MPAHTEERSKSSTVTSRWRTTAFRRRALLPALVALAIVALSAPAGASAETFSSSGGSTINDGSCSSDESTHGKATPYPSTIDVSGLAGVVQDVNVTLSGFTHFAPLDVRVLLVGPQGQTALLMHENGSTDEVYGLTLTFDDAAAQPPAIDAMLTGGTFKPSNQSENTFGCEWLAAGSFPSPAPAGPYGSTLSGFTGSDPNGEWKLYVVDTYLHDGGSLSGWSVDISATASVGHT